MYRLSSFKGYLPVVVFTGLWATALLVDWPRHHPLWEYLIIALMATWPYYSVALGRTASRASGPQVMALVLAAVCGTASLVLH